MEQTRRGNPSGLGLSGFSVGTVHGSAVRFQVNPQDHQPIHAHGRYAGTIAIVELRVDRTVSLAERKDRIIPRDAKASDVRKILKEAVEFYDEIAAEWEKMQRED